jgi:hypothetical protein
MSIFGDFSTIKRPYSKELNEENTADEQLSKVFQESVTLSPHINVESIALFEDVFGNPFVVVDSGLAVVKSIGDLYDQYGETEKALELFRILERLCERTENVFSAVTQKGGAAAHLEYAYDVLTFAIEETQRMPISMIQEIIPIRVRVSQTFKQIGLSVKAKLVLNEAVALTHQLPLDVISASQHLLKICDGYMSQGHGIEVKCLLNMLESNVDAGLLPTSLIRQMYSLYCQLQDREKSLKFRELIEATV